MTQTHVAELKQRLSHFLGLVQQGDEIIVTSHQKRIARIIPDGTGELSIRNPTRPVRDLKAPPKRGRGNKSTELLLEDRGRR